MRVFPTGDSRSEIDTSEAAMFNEEHVLVTAQTAPIYETPSHESSKGGLLRE